jgi:PhnB protein
MQFEPYLFFHGRCEEALNFYASALGGNVERLTRIGDSPMAQKTPQDQHHLVMHASFVAPGFRFMASDGRPGAQPDGEDDIVLSLATEDAAEGERVFAALSSGGRVDQPLEPAFWGGRFGSLTDKFGMQWMVSIYE